MWPINQYLLVEYLSRHIRGHIGPKRRLSERSPGQNELLSHLVWSTPNLTQLAHIFSWKMHNSPLRASSGDHEEAYQGISRHAKAPWDQSGRVQGHKSRINTPLKRPICHLCDISSYSITLWSGKRTVSSLEIHLEASIYQSGEPDVVAQWRQNSKFARSEQQIQL